MTLPPIPDSVPSQLGPIPVTFVAELEARDEELCFGLWDTLTRTIKIRDGLPINVQWQVLIHEQVHQILFDAGVKLDEALEEIVCDCLASARVAEMLAAISV